MRLAMTAVLAFAAGCFPAHDPQVVELTLRECESCHLDDEAYKASANHVTRSTTCANCHRLFRPETDPMPWIGLLDGTHPERAFPLSEGPHRRVLCADCHNPAINPDSTVATPRSALEPALQPDNVICTDCHAHELGAMARKHHEENGYSPAKCRACHRDGINTDD
jgi:hypothetical protein